MAGGAGLRPRGPRKGARQDGEGERSDQGPALTHRRAALLWAAAGALPIFVAVAGCATHRPPSSTNAPRPADARVLYQGESDGPDGSSRFRVGAAVRAPDHLRLEVFGPMGGPRLVLATDGRSAVLLLPHEHHYDRAGATSGNLSRLTGLPLDAAGLVALVRGQEECPGRVAQVAVGPEERDAPITCVVGNVRYSVDRGAWPEHIEISMARPPRSIRLHRVDGPAPAHLADDLFAPPVPEGFDRRDLFGEHGPADLLFREALPGEKGP